MTYNGETILFKAIAIFTFGLVLTMAGFAFFKGQRPSPPAPISTVQTPVEITLETELKPVPFLQEQQTIIAATPPLENKQLPLKEEQAPLSDEQEQPQSLASPWPISADGLPYSNRINELFNLNGSGKQLPIVETITYKSRVHWHKGSPAWISDYASHYNTSRHFIARSLNGKPDYFKQDIAEGKRFNVYRSDKNFEYYILVDVSRCKLWLYYIDKDDQERVLLKTYDVGLGRFDENKISGLLTPLGKYSLGNRIAIYTPGIMGHYKGKKVEMLRVFGTRWIPFDKEIANVTEPAKGFGLHGVPWVDNGTGKLAEDTSSVGKYESDGCIRMAAQDIEELYAILITKPSTIELVEDFSEAQLPGKGKE
jgi:hypothetical protein